MNYFEDILYFMNEFEKLNVLSGVEKKGYVIKKIIEKIGEKDYEKYDLLINNTIEFLIKLSYKELKIKFNKLKKNCIC
jgi:hypothetical protein